MLLPSLNLRLYGATLIWLLLLLFRVLWHCWLSDRKGIWAVIKWVLVCWWWRSDWSFARLIAQVSPSPPLSPAPIKPSNPGSPGKMAVKAERDRIHSCGRKGEDQWLFLAGWHKQEQGHLAYKTSHQNSSLNVLNREQLFCVTRTYEGIEMPNRLSNNMNCEVPITREKFVFFSTVSLLTEADSRFTMTCVFTGRSPSFKFSMPLCNSRISRSRRS